jgi:hypothetical protein
MWLKARAIRHLPYIGSGLSCRRQITPRGAESLRVPRQTHFATGRRNGRAQFLGDSWCVDTESSGQSDQMVLLIEENFAKVLGNGVLT